MNFTSSIFEAYLKCPTKGFLCAHGETGSGNLYADWVQTESETYRCTGVKHLAETVTSDHCVTGLTSTDDLKSAKWTVAVDVVAQSGNLESKIHAIERVPSDGRGKAAQFIPIRFIFRNKLTTDDKLLLAFDAMVLSKMCGRPITAGKIIHGDDHSTLKVKIVGPRNRVGRLIEKLAALLSTDKAPDLVLIRHCGECEFQTRCRQKAVEKDDLSLLSGLSEKERKKLNGKGIFTVTQLSYTFRPRRRKKKLRDKREKYHHSLKALAIREQKIHIVGIPELKIEGTPVYFDVEGLPDRNFYYLIGIRIGDGEKAVQHSLWADEEKDEKTIWEQFLAIVGEIRDPVLIHYGSYETIFLKRMAERHGQPNRSTILEKAIAVAVNLLSFLYGRVYFPTRSNGLKEIANYLGIGWSNQSVGGLTSIVWRERWQLHKDMATREALTRYNAEDCVALSVVTRKISDLALNHSSAGMTSSDVVDTLLLKREHPFGFKCNTFCLPELDVINRAAYWDYQRERIYIRTSSRQRKVSQNRPTVHRMLPISKTVVWSEPRSRPHLYLYQGVWARKEIQDRL